jgi:hypothetical protein
VSTETWMTIVRLVGGIGLVGLIGALAWRRASWLYRLVKVGRPMPERTNRDAIRSNIGFAMRKIFGQEKLLRWSLPGIAHFWVMYAFFVLQTTLLEAGGEVVFGTDFQIPLLNRIGVGGVTLYDVLGASQDTFMLLSLTAITIFAAMRFASDPRRQGRSSRFAGSNLNQGWWTLLLEALTVWTLLIAHGARFALDHAPTEAAFASRWVGDRLAGIDPVALEWIALVNLLGHIAIVGSFLLFTLHSKHLHILTIPFPRRSPSPSSPRRSASCETEKIDIEEMDEDDRPRRRRHRAVRRSSACSTCTPAPSAAAARASARRGTPASRCRPSC